MKKIKTIFIVIFLSVLTPNVVFAHSAAGGNTATYGACSTSCSSRPCEWCYSPESKTLRFSVYKYKNGTLTYYKSVDYSTSAGSANGKTALIVPASSGKIAYQNGKSILSWSSQYYKLEIKNGSSKFSCYFGGSCEDFKKNEIEKEFGLNVANPNIDDVRTKVNVFFGLTGANAITNQDLQYVYITVEPALYIYDRNGHSYYGTAYELLNMSKTKNGQSLYGVNGVVYKTFPLSIIALNPSATDGNKFVGFDSANKVKVLNNFKYGQNGEFSLDESSYDATSNANRLNARNSAVSKNGYGIGVFWLGENLNITCSSYIAGASDKVAKAAEYCKTVEGKNNLSSVKSCMSSSCGLSEPAGYSCSSNCPSQTSKSCPNSNESTINTCSSLNGGYIKISCSDKQKITPSDDLPSIFYKGTGGFNYSVNVNGSKTCNLYFNNDKYYYNLKAAVTTSENNDIRQIRNKYVNFDFTEYMYKNDKYEMQLTVGGETVGLKEVENQTQIKITTNNGYSGTTVNSIVEDNPQKKITATISSKYEVLQACYSLKTGKIDRTNLLAGCGNNKLENIGYYAFYINAMNLSGEYPKDYNTTLTIKKVNYINGSRTQRCTLGSNNCKFTVRNDTVTESASCSISTDDLRKVGSEYKATVYIKGNNRGTGVVTCRLNNSVVSCDNGSATITLKENDSKAVEGSITYDGVTIPCNTVISTPGPTTVIEPPRCTEKFSKTNKNISHYADIRNYCNENWKIDKDNYSSSSDCFNKCTQIPGVCKTTYKCSDKTGIQSYCNLNWQNDGYKSIEMCVNDCSCSGDVPSALDFIYRPIAVGGNAEHGYNAFPNRSAGSNWTGYESYTEYDNFDKAPIYVIELDEESIKDLKNDTRGDISNYVDYAGELEDNSYYKSELIDDYKGSIFTCINGSGRCN